LITGYALDKKVIDPKVIKEVICGSAIGYETSRSKGLLKKRIDKKRGLFSFRDRY